MNPLGLRYRFPQPKAPLQASPLRFENQQASSQEQQPPAQVLDRRASESALTNAMSSGYNFVPPTQLSPSSQISSQQVNQSQTPISHSTSQFASPIDHASMYNFNFSQPQSHHSSPSEQFSLKSFPQQPQIQQYQQQFLHQRFQQQQQQLNHPHAIFRQQDAQTTPFSRSQSVPSTNQTLHAEHSGTPRLTIQTPSPAPETSPQQEQGQDAFVSDDFSFQSFLQEPSNKRHRPSLDAGEHRPQTQASEQSLPQQRPPSHQKAIISKRPHDPWMLRGSCACCQVQYEINVTPSELPLQACYCHCAVCRNLSGSNYIAFTSIPSMRIKWYSGQWDWKSGHGKDITSELASARNAFSFGKAPGFSKTSDGSIRLWSSSRRAVRGSCSQCGSALFISYHSGVATTDIALGTLWNAEERGAHLVKPVMHIMLREKALWDEVPDDGLLRYDGMPGEGLRKPPAARTKDTPLLNIKHLLKCMLVY